MKSSKFLHNLLNLQSNMLSFAYALTSNREDAYDLMQDTTLKALDNQEKFAEETNFKGCVLTIMRNIFVNNYRRTVREATMVDTTDNLYYLNQSHESTLDAPEDTFHAGEITKAIDELPQDLGKPFAMHVAGYKYEEIASKLNVPLGTIKSRIFTARRILQERFADYR